MSVPSPLLRVLLSISLILNGSSYAMASMHMQMGHGPAPALAVEQAPDSVDAAEPPCHQHQNGVLGLEAPLSDTASDTASIQSEIPPPECCKSGSCRCACVHQVQVAVSVYSLDGAVIEHADVMPPLNPGHAAPVLPHLIRPPIG